MMLGAYVLHLYCEVESCELAGSVYVGDGQTARAPLLVEGYETRQESVKEARRRGWTVNVGRRTARCPKHARKR